MCAASMNAGVVPHSDMHVASVRLLQSDAKAAIVMGTATVCVGTIIKRSEACFFSFIPVKLHAHKDEC